ncbi:carboxypeptidase-like regulatory domain-containing protein, partial [bacterium AH-315-A23]|nr:carboxypeptidase-like regulatory domain-containing protein [bacterium AH-315-A23]
MKNILFAVVLFPLIIFSQTRIQGIVIDSNTKQPLPFASIVTNTNFGTLADVEGRFYIKAKNSFNQITISYVGYQSVIVPIEIKDKFIHVKLKASVEKLNEVIITAKENPALQIIRNTIKNKPKNNIEKSLNSFKFNTYNKILVTANPDSISGKVDSVFVIKEVGKTFKKLDSSNYKFKKEIDKQHLYISEKIS